MEHKQKIYDTSFVTQSIIRRVIGFFEKRALHVSGVLRILSLIIGRHRIRIILSVNDTARFTCGANIRLFSPQSNRKINYFLCSRFYVSQASETKI